MPLYSVEWREKRTIKCYAEIEADNENDAMKMAQDYSVEVEECEEWTDEVGKARVTQIEE